MAQTGMPNRWRWPVGLISSLCLLGGCLPPSPPVPLQTQATSPARRVHWRVPHRYQGTVASCGPSALWSVLIFHLGAGSVDFPSLDRALRPNGTLNHLIGVLPGKLAATAAAFGLTATVHNRTHVRQLRRLIDAGLPVILLGEYVLGGDSRLHYVVLNGYERQDGDTVWLVTDSLEPRGVERRWTTRELLAFWDDVAVFGLTIPYQRAIIAIAPGDKASLLPSDNRDAGILDLEERLQPLFEALRGLDNGGSGS